MKKTCLTLLGGIFFFAAACTSNKVPDKKSGADTQMKKEITMDWSGTYCSKKESGVIVVDNQPEWEEVWKTTSEKPAPEVDFAKYVVVAVFVGEKNTGGYSVEFLEPAIKDGKKVVPYRIKSPGESFFVIQSLTQSYHLRTVEKGALPVVPEEVK